MKYHLCTLSVLMLAGVAGAAETVAVPAAQPESTTPRTRAGTRVARVEDTIPKWDATIRLGAGWDSNALQVDDRNATTTATAVYSTEATAGWRAHADESSVVRLSGTAGYDLRPHLDNLDTLRAGLGLTGTRQFTSVVGGGSLNLQRYWIDGQGAAFELRTGLGLGWLRQNSADLVAIEAAVLPFDTTGDGPSGLGALTSLEGRDDHSGILGAASWRHWWMLAEWRVEAGLRGGLYDAQSNEESYLFVAPWAGVRWRNANWQADAKFGWDGRSYDEERVAGEGAERSQTVLTSANLDRKIADHFWIGVIGGAGLRASSSVGRDYERWLAGLRLTWNLNGN